MFLIYGRAIVRQVTLQCKMFSLRIAPAALKTGTALGFELPTLGGFTKETNVTLTLTRP